ncbi:uncharacterized protein METZ01_LOCUS311223 [marine metagenome]|uniref:3'-5' exoribonuclease Rv2179c-like domain-containing protein n=1 Tax=marine metagenome TaxID=408172 RepID=A0A382NB63_9ZZZZ
MATHAMIDIETLGTKPNAVILSVGATKFDPFTSIKPFDDKHWKIDVDAQTEINRDVNEDTLTCGQSKILKYRKKHLAKLDELM